ncbi:MAG: enoyl-CoA hydratase-related protein [Candidatus Promineifilaceae bacterium]|nr:enoyl-CoA hydratase-related protein [Candidatus Promineifilaceae bacterium]
MSETVVTFSKDGGVGFITLDRPPANSYEIDFMRQLDAAIEAARDDGDVKAVILRSASDRFFSAGADIKAFMANDTAGNMEMIRVAHAALAKMAAIPKIFVAAINGHALGGGLEMALACDLRFAAEGDYRMGLPEVTLGLLPGNGGTQRLPRLIGWNKALQMMITGEQVGPEEAAELGIVNRVIPADELQEETEAYAQKIASGATLAIGAIKEAVYRGRHLDLDEALALERELIEPLFDTEDAAEGFAAFTEKRPPEYKGR